MFKIVTVWAAEHSCLSLAIGRHTAKVIIEIGGGGGGGLVSLPTNLRESIKLGTPGYKASGLSTTQQQVLPGQLIQTPKVFLWYSSEAFI